MLGLGHLSSFTSPTQMVLEEFDSLDANDVLLLQHDPIDDAITSLLKLLQVDM